MFHVNLPHVVQNSLNGVDEDELEHLINKCIYDESSAPLARLRLSSCGEYVYTHLRGFERALDAYNQAIAPHKRAHTKCEALEAGVALADAISQMKRRVANEETEQELFFVYDEIVSPPYFGDDLSVSVKFRWRNEANDSWQQGSIIFLHTPQLAPTFHFDGAKPKLSASKAKQDMQNRLHQVWQHLRMLSVSSVKEFLSGGGDGHLIPHTFRAVASPHGGGLNNHSAKFWSLNS